MDQDAWREFATYYGGRMYQWCLRWGLQDADARDVAQQVLLKLASVLRGFSYDPARSFRGWLRTLTHHAWQDFLTAGRRAVSGSGDSAVLERLASLPARDDFCSALEEAFDQEVLQQAIDAVRSRVQPATWEAFRLTALDGVSPGEVASRLNKTVGAVYMMRSRFQNLLREEVQRLSGEDGPALPPDSA